MNQANERRPARTKLILAVVLLNLVVFTAFTACVVWLTSRSVGPVLHDEALNSILLLAEDTGRRAVNPLLAGDAGAIQHVLRSAMVQPDVAYGFVRDADGRIRASTFEDNAVPDELGNIQRMEAGVPFSTEDVRFASAGGVEHVVDVAAALGGGAMGSLHIGWNVENHQRFVRRIFMPVVIFAAAFYFIAAVVLVVLLSLLMGRMLRPAK